MIYLILISNHTFSTLVPSKGLEQRPMHTANEHQQLLVLTALEPQLLREEADFGSGTGTTQYEHEDLVTLESEITDNDS